MDPGVSPRPDLNPPQRIDSIQNQSTSSPNLLAPQQQFTAPPPKPSAQRSSSSNTLQASTPAPSTFQTAAPSYAVRYSVATPFDVLLDHAQWCLEITQQDWVCSSTWRARGCPSVCTSSSTAQLFRTLTSVRCSSSGYCLSDSCS